MHPVSCDPLYLNGMRSTKSQTSPLFLLPSMSLAVNPLLHALKLSKHNSWCIFPCTNSLNLLNLAGHPLDLLNQQNQCSKYSLAPRFVSQTVCITFKNQGTVL